MALAARLVCKTSSGKTEQPCRNGKCRVNRGQAWVEECQGPEVIFTKDRCKSDKKTRSQSSPQLRTSSITKDMCTLMWPRPDHRAFGQCLHRVSAFPRARILASKGSGNTPPRALSGCPCWVTHVTAGEHRTTAALISLCFYVGK